MKDGVRHEWPSMRTGVMLSGAVRARPFFGQVAVCFGRRCTGTPRLRSTTWRWLPPMAIR
ncbi:MAG: hypothetical protein D6725_05715 [Planctomycetota bacterium]|nr:MAG: hypothetical protein D6725_05715 [Planctomycetota bacterium]